MRIAYCARCSAQTTERLSGDHAVLWIDVTLAGPTHVYSTSKGVSRSNSFVASAATPVRSDVKCGQEGILVEIPLNQFGVDDNTDDFRLQDRKCSLTSRDGKLVAEFGFSDCGTVADFTENAIIYKNFITPMRGGDSVPIICEYPRHTNVSLSYMAVSRSVRFYEKGVGSLKMIMQQFNSSEYQNAAPLSDPVFVNTEEPVFMEVRVTSGMSRDLIVFPTKCLASASPSPTSDSVTREIIRDGCKKDPSVIIYPSPGGKFRFRFNAFSFPDQSSVPETYVHCEMVVCNVRDKDNRCQFDCLSPVGATRTKRSVLTVDRRGHFVSSGPFVLNTKKSVTGSSLVGVFAAVAVVSMVVAMVAVVVATVTVRMRRTKSKEEY